MFVTISYYHCTQLETPNSPVSGDQPQVLPRRHILRHRLLGLLPQSVGLTKHGIRWALSTDHTVLHIKYIQLGQIAKVILAQ